MGGLNVKNTIVERVLQIIAPHPCSGCGKVGVVLCDDCKYDIIHEPFLGCSLCGAPQPLGICESHGASIARAFIVGQRQGALQDVINRLKFNNVKAATLPLAELLNEYLPCLPDDIQIVPIPTVRSHIRQRGYDQVALLAQQLADIRTIPLHNALRRVTNATQHTAVTKNVRKQQAHQAFSLDTDADLNGKTVLLVDDIVTTGSTLTAAADILSRAGATVWVAALAYQPLD